jgi:5'-nucleotidase / UDP-sugar diphosphatase
MTRLLYPAVCLALLLLTTSGRAEPIEIVLLHLNDVYEIVRPGPTDSGGLTRVATLKRQLTEKNPNTVAILAGDFLSPSALGTAKIDGKRLDGQQMIATLNAIKLDFATFGNHEFDIPESAFLYRLSESKFGWFSSNITNRDGKPFPGVAPHKILTFRTTDGKEVKLGLLGLTIDTKASKLEQQFWRYSDHLAKAREQVAELREKQKVDIVVAITHLKLSDDQNLAREVPGIDLILGGHEHVNNAWRSSKPGVPPIFKADANVHTVYVHRLRFDPAMRNLDVESQLTTVSNDIPEDPATVAVVDRWVETAFTALHAESGHDPRDRLVTTDVALEGRESVIRRGRSNLTDLVGRALIRTADGADLAVYNSGMVRIDDLVPAGPFTYYDVLRMLPFGGEVCTVEVQGRMLQRLLNEGLSPKQYDQGSFLQTINVKPGVGERWLIQDRPLDPDRIYRVAMNDYLMNGNETALSFFKPGEGVQPVGRKTEIREAMVNELRRTFGGEASKPAPAAVDIQKQAPVKRPSTTGALYGLIASGVMLIVVLYVGLRSRAPGQ